MVFEFPRETNFKNLEENVQSYWEKINLLKKVQEKNSKGEKFYFLDGPPYASGSIHLGTAWNKTIKDAVLRYLTMLGYNVTRIPGWDCHGLPIEVKVEKILGIKSKKEIEEIGIEKFVEECKKFALKHVEIMTNQFKRLGILMDWDNPYMTLSDDYISSAFWTIKKAYEKGLLEKKLRTITTCPRCETVLAEAEVEYKDVYDPSIFVMFPSKDEKDTYYLVWTTTPWTLIGNVAIAAHPDYTYVKVKTERGNLILAKERLKVLEEIKLKYEIVDEFKGRELEGKRYEHPLKDYINVKLRSEKAYTIVLAEFVTLEEGTGLVHVAPGHGPEDFELGIKYGLDIICPVDERGIFKDEAGKYKGLRARFDDKIIIEDLKRLGLLLYATRIRHRYGHCWRCDTPIIYRATEQWFINVTKIKDKMLKEIGKAEWIPEWAGFSRFKEWVENAKDWTISRQRYWGIPLPIWICEKCGNLLVIGSKKELEELSGRSIKELHRPYIDEIKLRCNKCNGTMHRVKDVLDVWFDSGIAAWASLSYPEKRKPFEELFPAKLIIEGHDQTRGWFYSQLVCGVISFDTIPYRKVLMHGFVLDEKGQKMSKRLGNVVTPEEVIEKYSADTLRFYLLWANKTWEDLKFRWQDVKEIYDSLRILWNVCYFAALYMRLDNFNPKEHGFDFNEFKFKKEFKYKLEDLWILSRLNSLIKTYRENFEKLHLFNVARELHKFIVEDLSRWYITLIRPRTWIEEESEEKLSAYATLYEIISKLSILLAPIVPHIAEEIHTRFVKPFKDIESVHLERMIEHDESRINKELEDEMRIVREIIEASYSARDKRKIKRRWPLKEIIIETKDSFVEKACKDLKEIILKQGNFFDIKIVRKFGDIRFSLNEKLIGITFKKKAKRILQELKSRKITKEDIEKGIRLEIDGETIIIDERFFNIEKVLERDFEYEPFSKGFVIIDTRIDENLLSIAFAREIVRRIQYMRKELDLNVEDYIRAAIETRNEKLINLIKKHIDYISRETRAREIVIDKKVEHKKYIKDWDINGELFKISIEKI